MAGLREEIAVVLDEIDNHRLRCAVEDALARMRAPINEEPRIANLRAAAAYGLETRDVARYTGRIAGLVRKARSAGEGMASTAAHPTSTEARRSKTETYGGCYD